MEPRIKTTVMAICMLEKFLILAKKKNSWQEPFKIRQNPKFGCEKL